MKVPQSFFVAFAALAFVLVGAVLWADVGSSTGGGGGGGGNSPTFTWAANVVLTGTDTAVVTGNDMYTLPAGPGTETLTLKLPLTPTATSRYQERFEICQNGTTGSEQLAALAIENSSAGSITVNFQNGGTQPGNALTAGFCDTWLCVVGADATCQQATYGYAN